VAPTGGDKDTKEPRLAKTFPKNGSINFKDNEVKFVFNEWIDENNLKEQLIVIPTVDKYRTKVGRNTLTFYFDSVTLEKNTTYYFNLREGIKDITEGNKSDSATLVFSTGTFIDSLEMAGSAKSALDNKAEKNTIVQVFAANESFDLLKSKPLYQTKTENSGDYRIQYMKPGNYFMYAFVDENNNGKYEPNKEYIGYWNTNIKLISNVSKLDIKMVKEDHEEITIKSVDTKKGNVPRIEFNKEISSINIDMIAEKSVNVYPYINGKYVFLFPTNKLDSAHINITTTSLLENTGHDTLHLLFDYVDTSKCIFMANPGKGEIEPTEEIEIQLSKPYKFFKPIMTVYMGGKEYNNIDYNKVMTIKEDKSCGKVILKPTSTWKDSITIKMYPRAFEPVSGYLKDTLMLKYTLKSIEKFGTIGGEVNCKAQDVLVQLVGKDGNVVKQTNKKEFLFEYLKDGEYKLRIIEDVNKNNRWNRGDYRIRKMPERIYHYPETLKLKSNWEILDVKISF
jgi:uncharacterized protein (DUF2141 family)